MTEVANGGAVEVVSLYDSVANCVLENPPHDRADADVVAALNGNRAGELMVLYLNWRNRLISGESRQVMRSAAFDKNPFLTARSDAVGQIVRDIEQGKDLTKFLSRRIRTGFSLPLKPNKKQLGRLQHLDLLLNDWGVHYLHLSTTVEADGFVERDDPLLFAIFRSGKAYLLDLGTHWNFADDRLVQIAVETWPDDQLFHEIKGVHGSRENSYSPHERSQLRKAGIASFVQIGSKVYMPSGSISTAGTSARVSMQANRILGTLKQFEENAQKDPSQYCLC